jgi:hypothetical protein
MHSVMAILCKAISLASIIKDKAGMEIKFHELRIFLSAFSE